MTWHKLCPQMNLTYFLLVHTYLHRRQGPFCMACKTYTKASTFVKYVIKFVSTANLIKNFELVQEYVKNNKQIKYFKFFSRAY